MQRKLEYEIRLFFSEEDEGYIAVVENLKFDCVSAFGETQYDALRELADALENYEDADDD